MARNNSETKPPYDIVRERVKHVINSPEAPTGPEFSDWTQIGAPQLQQVEDFLGQTHQATLSIGSERGEEVLRPINIDKRFITHLNVMKSYIEALVKIPDFKNFLSEQNITPEFLMALVLLHDYGRVVFNGPFSLTYVDSVSDAVLREVIPSFPTRYLHSMKWITGEVVLPENDDELTTEQKIGLVLKALDTLGKLDANASDQLIDPETFFSEEGAHRRWSNAQLDNVRFPFKVFKYTRAILEGESEEGKSESKRRTRIDVEAEAYTTRDRELTLRGIKMTEKLIGIPFAELRNQAIEVFEDNFRDKDKD
jgi:hypothetical protein